MEWQDNFDFGTQSKKERIRVWGEQKSNSPNESYFENKAKNLVLQSNTQATDQPDRDFWISIIMMPKTPWMSSSKKVQVNLENLFDVDGNTPRKKVASLGRSVLSL